MGFISIIYLSVRLFVKIGQKLFSCYFYIKKSYSTEILTYICDVCA
jgi:hypothetical protein